MRFKKGLKLKIIAGETSLIVKDDHKSDMTKVITMNSTSKYLWIKFQESDFNLTDISIALNKQYNIDLEKANIDAKQWIESMEKAGLILES